MSEPRQVVIIGAGVAGLTSALTVLTNSSEPVNVTVLEAESTVGGRIRTTTFAGLSIDEGPDAFLARVPWATQLASELGRDSSMTSPIFLNLNLSSNQFTSPTRCNLKFLLK